MLTARLMGHDGLLETHGPMTGESGNINAPDAASSPVEGMSRNEVSSAQRFLLTVAGRRRAADELTDIMLSFNIPSEEAAKPMEGDTGRRSPKKHAAAHTGRFLMETVLRRDVDGLKRLIVYPFRFQGEVCRDEGDLDALWFSHIVAEGTALMQAEPYKLIYQMVANIDEFRTLDPDEGDRLTGIELVDDDFVVGIIVASGNVAQAVNYLLRWNDGAIKVVGIWT